MPKETKWGHEYTEDEVTTLCYAIDVGGTKHICPDSVKNRDQAIQWLGGKWQGQRCSISRKIEYVNYEHQRKVVWVAG